MESIVWAVIAFQIFLDAVGLALIAGALLVFAAVLLFWVAVVTHLALDWLAGRVVRLKGVNRDFIFLVIGLSIDVRNWFGWLALGAIYFYLKRAEIREDEARKKEEVRREEVDDSG